MELTKLFDAGVDDISLSIMSGCHMCLAESLFGKPVCKGHSGLRKVLEWSQQSHCNGIILIKDHFGVTVKRDEEE